MILEFAISLIGLTLLLLNSVLFLFKLKNKNKEEHWITIYLSLLFIIELLCHLTAWVNPGGNFFLSHYQFSIQFFTLSLVFYHLLKNKKIRFFILSNLFLVPLIIGYTFFKNPTLYNQFNIIEIILTSSAIALYAIFYLLKTITLSTTYFYFSIGLLLYLCNSIFIFISGNTNTVLIEEPYLDIWIFNVLFFITYQILTFKNWKQLKESKKITR